MSIQIVALYGRATLQGRAIAGYRKFGVPPGGAFDPVSSEIANALVGNSAGELALELTNAAVELRADVDTWLSICGATQHAAISDRTFETGSSFILRAGETLTVPAASLGWTTYIATPGGFAASGPRTVLAQAGHVAEVGEVFLTAPPPSQNAVRLAEPFSIEKQLRFVRLLPFHLQILTVSLQSDRVGIRLDGCKPAGFPEKRSEPACVGAIQMTPSGQLAIVGPDGPTIGGYPKIGVVVAADLHCLGQLRPSDKIELVEVPLEEARKLAKHHRVNLERKAAEIRVAARA